ncbi:MAG: hypothetical protein AB8B53_13965 [Flavobacteriales bacterium]
MNNRTCLHCNQSILEGRRDKKYCNAHCRSAHQYEKTLKEEPIYYRVKRALGVNRKIMKKYNASGYATIRKQELINEGFNPRFTTHSWKNRKGEEYKFIFEFGFLETEYQGKIKYKLIKWQEYMN